MERRRAPRKLTTTRVVAHHEKFDATPLKTTNMSQNGVFVSTNSPVEIRQGTKFDLTFMIDLGSVTKLRKVPATVMQSTPEGIGFRLG